MRSAWPAVGGVAILAALSTVLSACGWSPPERQAGPAAATVTDETRCDPQFPTSSYEPTQFFDVRFQLTSCLPHDIPLSVDVPITVKLGQPLPPGPGGGVPGPTLAFAGKPPVTLPHGSRTGHGEFVSWQLVPYWDGHNPQPFGPCAASLRPSKGDGRRDPRNRCQYAGDSIDPDARLVRVDDFGGSWAVYLPTATLLATTVPLRPFPYVNEYFQTDDPAEKPGAVSAGTSVVRLMPGRGPLPFFTESSRTYDLGPPSASPPEAKFVPTTCLNNLVLKNGANNDPNTPTDWSSLMSPPDETEWDVTVVRSEGRDLDLVSGWQPTQGGQSVAIQLNDPLNRPLAKRPHYVKGLLRDLVDEQCAGSANAYPVAMVGGRAERSSFASATLASPLLANSTMLGTRFAGSVLRDGPDGPAMVAFSRFPAIDGQSQNFKGAGFAGAQVIGTAFGPVDLTGATFTGARLYYSDLRQATGLRIGNAHTCQTWLPGATQPDNSSCGLLPKRAEWPSPLPLEDCTPASCAFVSIYNNTTRTLTRGLQWCEYGGFADEGKTAQTIAPLDTAQFMARHSGSGKGADPRLSCSLTFANGPWGKVRVRVAMGDEGKPLTLPVDSGTCYAARPADCLPRAAPATLPAPTAAPDSALWPPDRGEPIRISTKVWKERGATFADVNLCEPEAYDPTTGCATTPRLPAYGKES